MQLAKLRLAKACRTVSDDAGDDAANGVALGLHLSDELFHELRLFGVGASHGICLGEREVVLVVVGVEGNVAHLRGVGLYADARGGAGPVWPVLRPRSG